MVIVKILKNMKKKISRFRPKIRSRHPSHHPLRSYLPLMPFRSVIRLGSTTDLSDTVSNGGSRIEVNTIQAIKNASNKKLMKECFTNAEVKTADWWTYMDNDVDMGILFFDDSNWQKKQEDLFTSINDLPYPIVAKHIHGSRGTGNYKLDNAEELKNWISGKNLNNYIFEKFYNYSREYRLHVTEEGCFYTCRKMLKSDTPENNRWYRNDSNSVWVLEENELFDKPVNWDEIVEESVKSLTSVGLDFGAVDLKIQSSTNSNGEKRDNPKFIVLEINSAPSFGELTLIKYLEEIPKILTKKNG